MTPEHQDEFREFVASRMGALRNLAFLTCGNWHAAEDAVANALSKLYPRWGRLDHPDSYARTMVIRAAIDEVRRPWWRHERPAGDAIPDLPHADPSGAVDDRLRIRTALRAVPVRQRAVLVLRFYLGLTAEEAGKALGLRAGTVRSQTARGLAKLQAALAAEGIALEGITEHEEWPDANAGSGGPGDVRVTAAALQR
ncbi:SigE family RNA polymerase sigma factor [Solwaraspora sp. WMMA2056]|uniref:SigE family RNA polymerase sigma factor n=1 Tax=Solwaraspora sp. WMMA2056 TaxID=3015161 RepID=UPI00259BBFC3|nr:SigE family RNA polymerase sigma factor [Solwaraspora sp. WMMA2056]WJK40726.1 SigE family RNA polymerase sigma factor [Solwaraspora sp. WMMA2056]